MYGHLLLRYYLAYQFVSVKTKLVSHCRIFYQWPNTVEEVVRPILPSRIVVLRIWLPTCWLAALTEIDLFSFKKFHLVIDILIFYLQAAGYQAPQSAKLQSARCEVKNIGSQQKQVCSLKVETLRLYSPVDFIFRFLKFIWSINTGGARVLRLSHHWAKCHSRGLEKSHYNTVYEYM